MSMRLLRAGLSGLAIMLVPSSKSFAHEIVGNRFFPATLGIDDPGVNGELAFPTVSSFKTGDDPSFRQRDFSGEFSKRITEAFAVSFGSTYSHLSPPATSRTVTTGTNPGFIWVGNTFQVAVEALIPISRQSGTNTGAIAQLHFFLDDIDPRGIGRPIFGNAPPPATPFGRN